ncbi:MAG: protoporphyrinogen oxidase [Gammaproteobacteria bacterium]
MTIDVAIIGAGISGLSTAHFLGKGGCKPVVLERRTEAGGTIRSEHAEGFLVEAGPNSTAETTPVIEELLGDLGIRAEKLPAAGFARHRYILRGGRLHPLPTGPGSFLTTPLWSRRAKLRLLLEPFVRRAGHEETIAEFVRRRLGHEFLDYAVDPFVAGIYAGNPRRLSVRAAFPKLDALEQRYGGLIKGTLIGARARRKQPTASRASAPLFSFRTGMATLPRTLAASLGPALHLNTRVRSVAPAARGFKVVSEHDGQIAEQRYDAVVLSVPAYAAAELLRDWMPELAGRLEEVKYPPVTVVALGYRSCDIRIGLDGFGFLVPEIEGRGILGTIWNSSLFPGRAPPGSAIVTTFIGGARQPECALQPDEEIFRVAHEENAALMGIGAAPVFRRLARWRKAIPQYNLGHLELIQAIAQAEQTFPGLRLCSNFRDGISVADCIANGKRTAERLLRADS